MKDGFEYTIHFFENLVVPEPQYAESGVCQDGRAFRVGCGRIGMLATIELDDEPSFQAYKIDDVVTERMLSTELASVQSAHPQPSPQRAFGIGGGVAKPARPLWPKNPRIGLALHRSECSGVAVPAKPIPTQPNPTLALKGRAVSGFAAPASFP